MSNQPLAHVADERALPHLPRAVGYRHTMDNTEGLKANKPWRVFAVTKPNPFGTPGLDYSASYPVTTEALFTAIQMVEYVRTDRAAAQVGDKGAADDVRIALLVQVDELCSQIENSLYAFRGDEEATRQAQGAIDYAKKVAKPYRYNLAAGAPAETPKPCAFCGKSDGTHDWDFLHPRAIMLSANSPHGAA